MTHGSRDGGTPRMQALVAVAPSKLRDMPTVNVFTSGSISSEVATYYAASKLKEGIRHMDPTDRAVSHPLSLQGISAVATSAS